MSVEKIYGKVEQIPPKPTGVVRTILGGGLDWLHRGHIAYLEIAGKKDLLIPVLRDLDQDTSVIENSEFELVVRVKTDSVLRRKKLRPILPLGERLRAVAELDYVSYVISSDLSTLAIARLVEADIAFYSTTTKDYHSEENRRKKEELLRNGIRVVTLPELVDSSTTKKLKNFFLGSTKVNEIGISFKGSSGEESVFPLLYAGDLCLTPNIHTVEIAADVVKDLKGRRDLK